MTRFSNLNCMCSGNGIQTPKMDNTKLKYNIIVTQDMEWVNDKVLYIVLRWFLMSILLLKIRGGSIL